MNHTPSSRTARASYRRAIALALCVAGLALAPGAAADGDPLPDGLEAVLCGSDAQRNALNALPATAGRCVTSTDYQNPHLEGQPSLNQSISIPPEDTACVDVPQPGFFCPNNGFMTLRTEGGAAASAEPNRTQDVGPIPTPLGTICTQTCQVPAQPAAHARLNATVTVTANGQEQTVPVDIDRGV